MVRRLALATAGLLLLVYCAALVVLVTVQRDMLYKPTGTVEGPVAAGLDGVEEFALPAGEGEKLRAWYAASADGRPTILFFHGNSGTLEDRAKSYGRILADGFGLLAITYRGFPGSTGEPSEAGLIEDGLSAFDWLRQKTGTIVIHGQSLGSGIAVQVAARREAEALVLEVPFSSAVAVAEHRYWMFPVRQLMWDQWRSDELIGGLAEPVLILAAGHDTVIPDGQAHDLFEHAREPKSLVTIPDANHNSMWSNGAWTLIKAFLAGLPKPG